MLIAHEDSLKFINDQVPVFSFRERWYYNNTGYEITGLILDKFRGSWAGIFREQFFGPLDMRRTFCKRPPEETENVSKAYNTLDNGTSCEISTVKSGEGLFGGSSGSMFSCVQDLLKIYAEIISSIRNQPSTRTKRKDIIPAKQINHLFSYKLAMRDPSAGRTAATYTCGLARVTLPGAMGYIGNNPSLLPDGKCPW